MGTKISWTNETWNPIAGCTKVSAGCDNCYAERMSERLAYMGNVNYRRVVKCEEEELWGENIVNKPDFWFNGWNNEIICNEKALEIPLHWKQPRMIFVCSMGDLFHPKVPFEFIDKIVQVIIACHWHKFQILTKRPEIALQYIAYMRQRLSKLYGCNTEWAWPSNVWLGTTCENQEWADKRIPTLLQIPAAVRFISAEPLLGDLDLENVTMELPSGNACVRGTVLGSNEGTFRLAGQGE